MYPEADLMRDIRVHKVLNNSRELGVYEISM